MNIKRHTLFNYKIFNDIRPFIVANLDRFNLNHKQIDEITWSIYGAFLVNNYDLTEKHLISVKDISENIDLFDKLKILYKDHLYLNIASFVYVRVNNLPVPSFNKILAFSNVLIPVGINDSCFKNNTDEVRLLRKRLEERFKLNSA